MKTTRGKTHAFLGMKITCQDNRRFSLGVKPHLEQTIDEFGEEPMKASTPARSDLFDVDESKPLVDEHEKKLFHRLVHRTMFCAGRGRKDFETTTYFLSKLRMIAASYVESCIAHMLQKNLKQQ